MQSNKVARQETMPTSIRQLVIVAYAPSEEHIDSRPTYPNIRASTASGRAQLTKTVCLAVPKPENRDAILKETP